MDDDSATAFELARFSAKAVAIIAASLHANRPIGDKEIKRLLGILAGHAALAPDVAKGVFDDLAETLAGRLP